MLRQLPVAARLTLHGTAETIPIPDVFGLKHHEVYDRLRRHWLSAHAHAAEARP